MFDKEWVTDIMDFLFQNDFSKALNDDYKDWYYEHRKLLSTSGLEMYSGCTKVCIIDEDNDDWVIKVSFKRSLEDYDESQMIDFSMREAEIYQEATKKHLEKYFAATYFVDEMNGFLITVQEKVDVDEDLNTSELESYVEEDYDEEDFEDEDDYRSAVYDAAEELDDEDRIRAFLGWDTDELITFIDEQNINDLHSGNWGRRGNGQFVMCDFGGYC